MYIHCLPDQKKMRCTQWCWMGVRESAWFFSMFLNLVHPNFAVTHWKSNLSHAFENDLFPFILFIRLKCWGLRRIFFYFFQTVYSEHCNTEKKKPNMAKHHQSSSYIFHLKIPFFPIKYSFQIAAIWKIWQGMKKTKMPIIPPLREQQWFIEFLSCFFCEGMYCHMVEVILYLYPVLT